MGAGRFTPRDWDKFTATRTAGRSTSSIFGHTLKATLDPKQIKNGLRESRDSSINPASTAIIVGLDVTGSMGMIADAIARDGLKTLFTEIYDRKPVSDPHVMFMGIGDALCDAAPLQVSQFEGDIRIADQLVDLWLEGGGGGNACESYTLPWYFAGMHTAIDCFQKRGKKGYLFTIGDEEPPEVLTRAELKDVLDAHVQRDLGSAELLDLASRQYEVFHVIVEQGNYCLHGGLPSVLKKWTALLGQRALRLKDYTKLPEVIVSAIQVNEGASPAAVAETWSEDTALVVRHAVAGLAPQEKPSTVEGSSTVVRF
jgi:hypothetical protein